MHNFMGLLRKPFTVVMELQHVYMQVSTRLRNALMLSLSFLMMVRC